MFSFDSFFLEEEVLYLLAINGTQLDSSEKHKCTLYDIYQITTSDRYIAYGSYILDIPTEDLKAVSVAFDQGKSAYVMFDKGKVDRAQLVRLLNDEKLSIRPMPPQETPISGKARSVEMTRLPASQRR